MYMYVAIVLRPRGSYVVKAKTLLPGRQSILLPPDGLVLCVSGFQAI